MSKTKTKFLLRTSQKFSHLLWLLISSLLNGKRRKFKWNLVLSSWTMKNTSYLSQIHILSWYYTSCPDTSFRNRQIITVQFHSLTHSTNIYWTIVYHAMNKLCWILGTNSLISWPSADSLSGIWMNLWGLRSPRKQTSQVQVLTGTNQVEVCPCTSRVLETKLVWKTEQSDLKNGYSGGRYKRLQKLESDSPRLPPGKTFNQNSWDSSNLRPSRPFQTLASTLLNGSAPGLLDTEDTGVGQ